MDVKAFGAYYSYGAPLPYASGVQAVRGTTYQTCRGVVVGTDGNIDAKFADGQTDYVTISGLRTGLDYRLALTEVGPNSTAGSVIFLY